MLFAWQGWKIEIPHRWSPLRLEGDYDQGYALIADLQRPRLGLRWKRADKQGDTDARSKLALAKEVGVLAASESIAMPDRHVAGEFAMPWDAGRLYSEPQPPGRDVWVGHSSRSSRTVQLVYHAQRRDSLLAGRLLPSLCDQPQDEPMQWAVFDLRCAAPAGWKLHHYRLNVGDLSLSFKGPRQGRMTVRQIALASLALKRQPLEKWLLQQAMLHRKHYRVVGEPTAFCDDGLEGLLLASCRRRRFFLLRSLAISFVTVALEDKLRDRLLLIEAADEPLLKHALRGIGSPLLAGASAEEPA